MTVQIKRAYDVAQKTDGFRILVDRLWPRGVSKAKAKIDLWLKDLSPSTPLRKWFGHDPKKWVEFQKRYRAELKEHKDATLLLKHLIKEKKEITLVYAAHDEKHNNAVALKKILRI